MHQIMKKSKTKLSANFINKNGEFFASATYVEVERK